MNADVIDMIQSALTGSYSNEDVIYCLEEALKAPTTAQAIRRVNSRMSVADNSRFLTIVLDKKVSYQHVRNTLERGEPKNTRKSARASTEELRKKFRELRSEYK